MDVDAVTLPEAVERGMVAAIAHSTFRQEGSSGHDVRTRVRTYPLMEFSLAYPLQNTGGNVDAVMRLHRVNGPNIGFQFTDWTDYRNDTAGGVGTVETIDSVTRLVKTYNTGSRSHVRLITRPKSGIVLAGGGAASSTTGIVTGGTPGTGWTGHFYVPVHFVEDILQVQILRARNAASTVLGLVQISSFTLREIPE